MTCRITFLDASAIVVRWVALLVCILHTVTASSALTIGSARVRPVVVIGTSIIAFLREPSGRSKYWIQIAVATSGHLTVADAIIIIIAITFS